MPGAIKSRACAPGNTLTFRTVPSHESFFLMSATRVADKARISAKNAEQLWRFIHRRFAEQPPDFCHVRIVFPGLSGAGFYFGIGNHQSEFPYFELFSVFLPATSPKTATLGLTGSTENLNSRLNHRGRFDVSKRGEVDCNGKNRSNHPDAFLAQRKPLSFE
jgi:hypothetical protein